MNQYMFLIALLLTSWELTSGQNLELMPGTRRFFADVQWLKQVEAAPKWSVFSRTRATVNWDGQTDLFTGAYLNHTTARGWGGSLVGRIGTNGAGADAGVHFFRANHTWMIFALVSAEIKRASSVSWFSILRFTPDLSENWKLYSSLELFSSFDSEGHRASVQRLRVGVARGTFQFGLGFNASGFGLRYQLRDWNPGVFIRTNF
ncbi:MAG: hypothetical protein AAF399_14255 [Bacteroidota bacterium]